MRCKHLFPLLLFLTSFASFAVENNSYVIEIPVNGQTQTLLMQQGFQSLVSELSDKTIPPLSRKTLLSLISEYQYIDKQGVRTLMVHFDKTEVARYLKENHLISDNSGPLLTWLVVKNGDRLSISGNEQPSHALNILLNQASQGHTQLLIPEMDLEDMTLLDGINLWQMDLPTIAKANQRYQQTNYLVIKLTVAQPYRAEWLLTLNNQIEAFVSEGSDLETALELGVNQLRNKLGVSLPSKAERVLFLEVTEIDGAQSFQELSDFLNNLEGVSQVELDGVTPEHVLYKIDTTLSKEQLEGRLNQDKRLAKSAPSKASKLFYRLNS